MQRQFPAFLVALFLSLAPLCAQAQGTDPGGTNPAPVITPPSGFEDVLAQMQAETRYRPACRELRTIRDGQGLPANSALRDFSGNANFIRAIINFCIHGDFILRGTPEGTACDVKNRMILDRQQYLFLSSLNKVSEQTIGRIELNCVEANAILRFDGLEAYGFRIVSSRFRQIFLPDAKISVGIEIVENSSIDQGFALIGSDVKGAVNVKNSFIGLNPAHKLAMGIVESKLRSLTLDNAVIGGNFETPGITVENDLRLIGKTQVKGNVGLNGTNVGGALRLVDLTIDGDINFWSASVSKDFVIQRTTIGGKLEGSRVNVGALLDFRGTTVTGTTQLRFITAGSITVVEKSTFKDDVRIDYPRVTSQIWIDDGDFAKQLILSHANVDGLLWIKNSRMKGQTYFNNVKVRSLTLEDSQLSEDLNMDYVRIEANLSISNSTLNKSVWARYGEFRRVYIYNQSKFGAGENLKPTDASVNMQRTRANVIEIRNVVMPNASFTGANAGEFFVSGTQMSHQLFLGNSRFNVLDIQHATEKGQRRESEIGLLDCSDCVVDQYALIGAKIARGVRLLGARINTLTFSEDASHSSWEREAVLDLTGLQSQVIQANDTDLRVIKDDKTCPGQLVRVRFAGVKFDNLVRGRVLNLTSNQLNATPGLFDRPVAAVRDWMLGLPSCWDGVAKEQDVSKRNPDTRFDPQPFETYSAALERSGRPEAATQLRILKRDEEIEVADYSALRNAALFVGKWVVSYGYENENALGWFVLLWFIGCIVYIVAARPAPVLSGKPAQPWYSPDNLGYAAFYSLDRAVPQLTLDKGMDRYSRIHPAAKYYFYFHRVMGASILIYAVAGLTGVLK